MIEKTDLKNGILGFTLVEVLVSVFVISITLSGLLAVILMGKQTLKTDKYRVKALNYAQETLEELKNYVSLQQKDSFGIDKYVHLPNAGKLEGDDSITYQWALDPTGSGNPHVHGIQNSTDVALGFARTYIVEDVDIGGGSGPILKKVTVTVTYPDVQP